MALPTLGQIGAQTARSTVKAVTDPVKNVARATVSPITKATAPIKSFLDAAAGGGKNNDGKKIVKNTGDGNGLLGRIAVATEKTVSLLQILVKGQTDAAKKRALDKKASAMNTELGVADISIPTKDVQEDATPKKKMSLLSKLLLAGAVISSVLENLDTEIGKFEAGWGTITLAVSGLALVAIPKILKAIRILKAAKLAYSTFMIKEFVQNIVATLKTITGKILWPVIKAMKILKAAFLIFKGFMVTKFVPAIVGTLTGLKTALAPVLVAAAPFVAIGLALGAAFLGLKLLLEKVTESLGFESISQTLMYGVYKLKDGMAAIANFFIGVYNKIIGFVKKGINALDTVGLAPQALKDFAASETAGTVQMLSTNNAEEYRKAQLEEQKAAQTDVSPVSIPPSPVTEPDARPSVDVARRDMLRRKEANFGLSVNDQNELRQINRRLGKTKVAAQDVQPAMDAAPGKVTVINNIDQSNNSKTASQTNSFNPMGVGAPAGI